MDKPIFNKAAYDIQYNRDNIIAKRVPFNRQNADDMRLLDWATAQGNFTAYVKFLIKQDMERSNTP